MVRDIKTQFKTRLADNILNLAPKILSRPLKLVPFDIKSRLLVQILGLIFSSQSDDRDLAFLIGRSVDINIVDLGLNFQISFDGKWQISEVIADQPADVSFSGQSQDLFLVAAGKEDPDTLFFQRKLCIEGDTELGLKVKSLLTSVELNALPLPVQVSINQLAQAIIKLQALAVDDAVGFVKRAR